MANTRAEKTSLKSRARSESSRKKPPPKALAEPFALDTPGNGIADATATQSSAGPVATDGPVPGPGEPTVAPCGAPQPKNTPSEYELLRLENMRRNASVLQDLGLDALKPPAAKVAASTEGMKTARAKKRGGGDATTPAAEPSRRSKRARGGAPDYTGEKIDRFGEEIDRLLAARERGGASAASAAASAAAASSTGGTGSANKPPQKDRQEVLEDLAVVAAEARAALDALRNQVRRPGGGGGGGDLAAAAKPFAADADAADDVNEAGAGSAAAATTEAGWRAEAVARWGPRVEVAYPPSWERFVMSRLPVQQPLSPNPLLQELHAACPWRLLVSCTLMSRVSSADTKRRCIDGFFAAFPTPSACLDEGEPATVLPIIDSLGLFENRYKSLVDITRRFLSQAEFDCQRDGEFKIYGIGDFGVSSFEIWCRGLGRALKPADKNLAAFCSWLRSLKNDAAAAAEVPGVENLVAAVVPSICPSSFGDGPAGGASPIERPNTWRPVKVEDIPRRTEEHISKIKN